MKCIMCLQYFKPTKFTTDNVCEDCGGVVQEEFSDEEIEVELSILSNPSGRTKAMIEDNQESFL